MIPLWLLIPLLVLFTFMSASLLYAYFAIFKLRGIDQMKFGFNVENELLNGRLAMVGLVIGVLTELITKQGILSQLGLM